ncbi:hypothetical protein STEG23_034857, partial [Scotinomys teguina]
VILYPSVIYDAIEETIAKLMRIIKEEFYPQERYIFWVFESVLEGRHTRDSSKKKRGKGFSFPNSLRFSLFLLTPLQPSPPNPPPILSYKKSEKDLYIFLTTEGGNLGCQEKIADTPLMMQQAARIVHAEEDSQSSFQYLAVDLCICFHQLLDKGSLMITRVVTNLITVDDQFRDYKGNPKPRKIILQMIWKACEHILGGRMTINQVEADNQLRQVYKGTQYITLATGVLGTSLISSTAAGAGIPKSARPLVVKKFSSDVVDQDMETKQSQPEYRSSV